MNTLENHGKIIREYEGKGVITLYDGQTCNCSVSAAQMSDGEIMAHCSFSENQNLVLSFWNKEEGIKSIAGITQNNENFLIEEHIFCTGVSPVWDSGEIKMSVRGGSLKYESKQDDIFSSARFGITNFEYHGNKHTEYPTGGGAWDILSIHLGDKTVEIHEVPDYKIIIESIKAQRGIDVTCEAVFPISSKYDLDVAMSHIDVLCELLSLARGTKINWIYYDCYDSLENKVRSFHKNSIVWRYTGIPLIDPRNYDETASFINQAYPVYKSMQEKYGLQKCIEAYLDAKREGTYLETRALVAAVLLDILSHKYVATHKGFAKNLEAMLKGLDSKVTEADLVRIINIRNSLVHEASFFTNESTTEYWVLIGMIDKIFLKILNYNGTFLDITNKFNRIDTNQMMIEHSESSQIKHNE
jgi:hypothetical protein